jgi:hypothetical protein
MDLERHRLGIESDLIQIKVGIGAIVVLLIALLVALA